MGSSGYKTRGGEGLPPGAEWLPHATETLQERQPSSSATRTQEGGIGS